MARVRLIPFEKKKKNKLKSLHIIEEENPTQEAGTQEKDKTIEPKSPKVLSTES